MHQRLYSIFIVSILTLSFFCISCGEETIKPQTWNCMADVGWYKTVTNYNHHYIATGILVNLTQPPRGEITTRHRICVSLWVRTAQELSLQRTFIFWLLSYYLKENLQLPGGSCLTWQTVSLLPLSLKHSLFAADVNALYSLPLPSSVPHQITFTLWKTEVNFAFYITVGSTVPSG